MLQRIRGILGWGTSQSSGVVDITPSMATALLEFNIHNRHISQSHLNYYKSMIENDEWELTSDAISFDNDGVLSNGQHRLISISESSKTCKCLVVLGISQSLAMDNGRPRNILDNVKLSDECCDELKNISEIHKMFKFCLNYCTGHSTVKKISPQTQIGVTNLYKGSLLAFHKAGLCKLSSKSKGIGSVAVTSAMFLAYMNGVDISILVHIRQVLDSGEMSSEYDKPILACRDRIMTLLGSGGREINLMKLKLTMDCIAKFERKSKAKSCKDSGFIYTYDFINNYKRMKEN